MSRRVVITGLGPISALGIGIEANWQAVTAGRSGLGPITAFDASTFPCRLAGEVKEFKVNAFVPKSYRKAVKVMARDIELAVGAADQAARDARLTTKGTLAEGDSASLSYPPARMGAHIGAGLIAADLNELGYALANARNEQGGFDIHKWGQEGMQQLTPLWLLKYLPNMPACHVTIIHDAQGPSNTITCGDASASLSIGESLRVVQRGAADACFCGGGDSKLNPMAFLRQILSGRLNTRDHQSADQLMRPMTSDAAGTIIGEGGGIVVIEDLESFKKRAPSGAHAYAEIVGFGASQSLHPESRNLQPDEHGQGMILAIQAALHEADIGADQIDLVVPFGLGWGPSDQAEAAALRSVLGEHSQRVALTPLKAMLGNCGAASGGLETCLAAKALAQQTLPATPHTQNPLPGMNLEHGGSRQAEIRHALVLSTSLGGQNAALLLRRMEKN